MEKNRWHDIWEKRSANFVKVQNDNMSVVFAELKRINGFDITDGGIPLEALIGQYKDIKEKLNVSWGGTLFEVGCGCGANLYMFHHDGVQVGGLDYSTKLISIMQEVLPMNALKECVCDEAVNLPVDIKYDAVLSNSVFSYFPDFTYAEVALEKMVNKAIYSLAVIDVHDADKKEEFMSYRIKNTEDYENRYKDLPKLFYPKEFFQKFAKKHSLQIKFYPSNVEGYWNNEFIYNVYMYK